MSALRYYTSLVIMAAASFIATAQSVSIEAPATVIQGNRFSVTISVNNSDAVVRTAPEIPNCKIFNASRPGVSTMQSTTIINGRVESSIQRQYTYLYKAEKASTVTIPAVSPQNPPTEPIPHAPDAKIPTHPKGLPYFHRTAPRSKANQTHLRCRRLQHLHHVQARYHPATSSSRTICPKNP